MSGPRSEEKDNKDEIPLVLGYYLQKREQQLPPRVAKLLPRVAKLLPREAKLSVNEAKSCH